MDLLFLIIGFLVAVGVLYVFIRRTKQAQEISKILKEKGINPIDVPSTYKQMFLLTAVTLSLAAFMLGFYVGSHGSPSRNSADITNQLDNIVILKNTFPGISYSLIYYNSETQTWRIYGSTPTTDVYIEYDDVLGQIKNILPIPKGNGAATPTPSVAPTTAPSKIDASKIKPSNKPARGAANAKNVIYEFSDFQCPYCKQGAANLDTLMLTHSNDTKIIFKQFPLTNLHPMAYPSALASECANEQGKFWEYVDYNFAHQDKITESDSRGNYFPLEAAQAIGIANITQFAECIGNQKYKSVVDAEMAEGQSLGIQGTPFFIINGNSVAGAYPPAEFEKYLK
jgi:protein-disulfide isomerase